MFTNSSSKTDIQIQLNLIKILINNSQINDSNKDNSKIDMEICRTYEQPKQLLNGIKLEELQYLILRLLMKLQLLRQSDISIKMKKYINGSEQGSETLTHVRSIKFLGTKAIQWVNGIIIINKKQWLSKYTNKTFNLISTPSMSNSWPWGHMMRHMACQP